MWKRHRSILPWPSESTAVVAPATANVDRENGSGRRDDFLTTLYLATTGACGRCSRHEREYVGTNAATRENVETPARARRACGPPEEGYLACGMTGAGRLASVEAYS